MVENFLSDAREIVRKCVLEHNEDLDAAKDEALRRIRASREFLEWVDYLVDHAIRDMVYQVRHQLNIEMLRKQGSAPGPGRPPVGAASEAVQEVARGYLDWYVAGKCLGDLLGKELLTAAESEDKVANGHLLKRDVLLELDRKKWVTQEGRVRDTVSEIKLRTLVRQVKKRRGEM